MEMKKKYQKPELKTQVVQLGVFGDYGGGGTPDGDVTPHPIKGPHPYSFMIE